MLSVLSCWIIVEFSATVNVYETLYFDYGNTGFATSNLHHFNRSIINIIGLLKQKGKEYNFFTKDIAILALTNGTTQVNYARTNF